MRGRDSMALWHFLRGNRVVTMPLPPLVRSLARSPFTWLLAALVLLLVIAPLVEGTRFGSAMFTVAMTTVCIAGTVANRHRKWVFRLAVASLVLVIPISWAALWSPSWSLSLGQNLIVIFFCGMTASVVLLSVLQMDQDTSQAVVGAICVYLLIGLTWATVYQTIELVQPDAFQFAARRTTSGGEGRHTTFAQLTYFSFVTMSTLGYGDITPRTPLAETACWMESILGQLYVAILIARLVSEMPRRRGREDS